jgi:hypothetical protein
MEDKDSGKKSEDSQSSNLQVSGEDLTQLIYYLQELQVKGASIQVSSSGGFSLSRLLRRVREVKIYECQVLRC